jgi:hypothetical protein
MTDPTERASAMRDAGSSGAPAPFDSAPLEFATLESAPVRAGRPAPRRRRRQRRRGGRVALVALIVVGLAGVLGGGAALGKELTRKATKAEQAAALAAEIASRWQRLPAGKIFPETISYINAQGDTATAALAAIAPRTSCQQALEPGVFQHVHTFGCTAMLRATYVDAAGTLAATVGVAVMSSAADLAGMGDLDPMKAGSGLYAVPASGTVASAFGNKQRGADGAEIAGPYLLLFTAGHADGIPGRDVTDTDELTALGSGVLAVLQKTLTSHTSPCAMKDIQC